MPLHPALDKLEILPENYRRLLNMSNISRRNALLRRYFDWLCRHDEFMQPGATPKQTYYKAFAQSLRIDLIENLIVALDQGIQPELPIRLDVAQATASSLGYKDFGSPQDFLYSFTSERSPRWSSALAGMGFKSAVMMGKQHAVVTMAPRNFDFSEPTRTIEEVSGAIASDFWETGALTGSQPNLKEMLDYLYRTYSFGSYPNPAELTKFIADLAEIESKLDKVPETAGYPKIMVQLIKKEIEKIHRKDTIEKKLREYNKLLKQKRPEGPNRKQEQIVLKYVQEGNLLQKLLGGRRVDHIQSNVKNQQNPWRQSACEVDSIYRIVGEKAIVLVEAKVGDAISRSQLYQIYETYRLKLPKDWEVIVIGALLSDPSSDMADTVRTVIDMAEIKFDDNALGRTTESVINMSLGRHYRWLIHQDHPQAI
jgi:hypothetical protein